MANQRMLVVEPAHKKNRHPANCLTSMLDGV